MFQGAPMLMEMALVTLPCPTAPLSFFTSSVSPDCVTVKVWPESSQPFGLASQRYVPTKLGVCAALAFPKARAVKAARVGTDSVFFIFASYNSSNSGRGKTLFDKDNGQATIW